MVIQHNLTAMNSNRQLGITTGLQAKSSEKLSSGYKINRAADDAAGLAISEKMRRQIRGLSQASENVQDGVSYVQVADGALSEIDDMLARITELCIQASNDTLTPEDRADINQEIQQIKAECNRVFHTTTFNNRKIWDENTTDRKIIGHVDEPIFTWSDQSYTLAVNDTNKGAWPSDSNFHFQVNDDGTAVTMSWTGYDGVNYKSGEMPLPSDEDLHKSFTLDIQSYMDYTAYPNAVGLTPKMTITLNEEADRDQLIAQLNSRGISASRSFNVGGTVYEKNTDESMSKMSISGYLPYKSASINYYAGIITKNSVTQADSDHIYTINATTQEPSDDNLTKDAGGNMTLSFGITKSDNAETDQTGSLTATATNTTEKINDTSNAIVYTRAYDTSNASSKGVWWDRDRYGNLYEKVQKFTSTSLDGAIANALAGSGNNNSVISDSKIGGNLIIPFNLVSNSNLYYTGKYGGETTEGKTLSDMGDFYLYVPISSTDTAAEIISRINNITGIDIQTDGVTSMSITNAGADYFKAPVWGGTMALNIQAGTNSSDSSTIPLIYDVLNNHSLGINDLNIKNRASSVEGIALVKKAASVVDYQRGVFGAYQNQMEHAVKNLDNAVENTQDAESLIRDTDMATEMVKHSNENILAQAGQAMLAQANQTNQGVMALLQ